MTEVRICDHEDLKRVRNYLLKQVQTMTISKVPWRKPPIPKQVAVICTRLILPDAVPAVKKYGCQRGSERTICLSKCPSRTVKGGAEPALLPVPIHAPPGQADSSYLLIKINDGSCSNTPPGSQKTGFISNKKEDAVHNRRHPLNQLFGSVLVHFQ